MESNQPVTKGKIETMTTDNNPPSFLDQSQEELDQHIDDILDEVEQAHKFNQNNSLPVEPKLTRKELRDVIEEILNQVLPERVKQTKHNSFTNSHNALPKAWRYIKTEELHELYEQLKQQNSLLSLAILKLIAQRNYYADKNKNLNNDMFKITAKFEQYRQNLMEEGIKITNQAKQIINLQDKLNYVEKKLKRYEESFQQFITDLPDLNKSEILQLVRVIQNSWSTR